MERSEAQNLLEAYKNIVEAGAHTEDGTYAMECIEKARELVKDVLSSVLNEMHPITIPYQPSLPREPSKSPYQPPYVTWVGTDTFGQETTYRVQNPDGLVVG